MIQESKREKKQYPIRQIVNWYFANYCMRKCFDKDHRLRDHHRKLLEFVEKNKSLEMTHSDFLRLFNDHMLICTLDDSFKRRSMGWKLFTTLQDTPNYDSDKIILEKGRVRLKEGELEKPKRCPTCVAFGIPP
ncbi:MAG TPA: hypothetical protein VJG90_01085 [Candidatus Nanoarchaeia archaeon]|nr:hypothetical protein [Candidatus Nanoarchaeia archaeon]